MRSLRLSLVAALVSALALNSAAIAARVEIVLDASGSMRAMVGGVTKMDAAKQAVRTTADAIDSSSQVALRLYGHRLPSEPKEASCKDTELAIPFAPIDRQRFASAVDQAKPLGQTPLAYSLEQAASDFGNLGDEPAAVILVSDGEESCGGDPAAVACAFAKRGIQLTVHTVGFDVDPAARQQLQAIAQCTGGEYRDAKDAGELSRSLQQLTQAGLLLHKERETSGSEVRGGNGFDSAVPITPGTYHLDHHQRPNEYDYFAVDLKPGHALKVTQTAYEVGVQIDGDTFKESSSSSAAGVAVFGPDRGQLARDYQISAGKAAEASGESTEKRSGRFYFAIGQDNQFAGGIHKGSPFTVELVDHSDGGSGTDATENDQGAVAVQSGTARGWFQGEEKDTYWFPVSPGGKYTVVARPDGADHYMKLTLNDSDGVQLASDGFNFNSAARVQDVVVPRGDRAFVILSTVEDKLVPYTLTISGTPAVGAGATGAAAEGAVAESTPAAGSPSLLSRIPGGCGCAAAAGVFLLLAVAAVVVVVIVVLRRRRKV